MSAKDGESTNQLPDSDVTLPSVALPLASATFVPQSKPPEPEHHPDATHHGGYLNQHIRPCAFPNMSLRLPKHERPLHDL